MSEAIPEFVYGQADGGESTIEDVRFYKIPRLPFTTLEWDETKGDEVQVTITNKDELIAYLDHRFYNWQFDSGPDFLDA